MCACMSWEKGEVDKVKRKVSRPNKFALLKKQSFLKENKFPIQNIVWIFLYLREV